MALHYHTQYIQVIYTVLTNPTQKACIWAFMRQVSSAALLLHAATHFCRPFMGNIDRPIFPFIWQRLLSSGAQVAEAELADYFFIPVRCGGITAESRVAARQQQLHLHSAAWA